MSMRYYVYRLLDKSNGELIFQGNVEIPEQTDHTTMNYNDARSMVADTVIRQMIRSSARPHHSLIQYCELQGKEDDRLSISGDAIEFDWDRCSPEELELNLGEED